jgi:multiple sugar transport system substrate-binding protein
MREELNFSLIGEPTPSLRALLQQFERQQQVTVNVWQMEWNTAWQELISYALHGRGPDISHIGSTWSSSLVGMNVLRPFSPVEVNSLGGEATFLPACWYSAVLPGGQTVWSMPWTSYTFVFYYRTDLFQQAGIDPGTAFSSPEAVLETVRRLAAAGIHSPIILPSGAQFLDRVHISASWIWGAGGDLISTNGKTVLFNRPAAHQGLEAFFSLYRQIGPADRYLSYDECITRFLDGRAAIVIAGIELAGMVLNSESAEVRSSLGVAPLPGVPWVGGDNLVIWQETDLRSGRMNAALALVRFLTGKAAQISCSTGLELLPVRQDVVTGVTFAPAAVQQAVVASLLNGRAQREVPLWGRIEILLGQALDYITEEVLTRSQTDLETIIKRHLDLLENRLNLMLS